MEAKDGSLWGGGASTACPSLPLTCPSVGSFHDDAPKDYRQVSLTAVKQRFEDKRYEEISQEEVLVGARERRSSPAPRGLGPPSDPGFPSGAELRPVVCSSRGETREPRTRIFPQHRGHSHLPKLSLWKENQAVSEPCRPGLGSLVTCAAIRAPEEQQGESRSPEN